MDLDVFRQSLDQVPWLEDLGKPTARDHEVHRLHAWEEWPGPEDPDCYALYEEYQRCYDDLLARAGPRRKEAEDLFEKTRQAVFEKVKHRVPFNPDEDAWHGPTQCVWDVSYWAGLVALYFLLNQTMGDEVQQAWSWVEAGHWPCGYIEGVQGRKLMVY